MHYENFMEVTKLIAGAIEVINSAQCDAWEEHFNILTPKDFSLSKSTILNLQQHGWKHCETDIDGVILAVFEKETEKWESELVFAWMGDGTVSWSIESESQEEDIPIEEIYDLEEGELNGDEYASIDACAKELQYICCGVTPAK